MSLTPPVDERASAIPPPNGHDRARAWLERVHRGAAFLPNVVPASLSSEGLPRALVEAATRAWGCRDLFVIEAMPEDRFRLMECLAANADGSRLLVLTPDRAGANRLVEALGNKAIRALAPDERVEDFPPPVAARTATAITRQLREHSEQILASVEERLVTLTATCNQITAVLNRKAVIDSELHNLSLRRERLAVELETDASLATKLHELQTQHEDSIAKLVADRATESARRQTLSAEIAGIRHSTEMKTKTGFFAKIFGSTKPDLDERRLQELEREWHSLEEHDRRLQLGIDELTTAHVANQSRVASEELSRRLAEIDTQVERLVAETEALAESLRLASENLTRLGVPVTGMDAEAVSAAMPELESLRTTTERRRVEARRNFEDALICRGEPARGLLFEIPTVVGPPECVGFDPTTAMAEKADTRAFNRLILDSAERFGESDYLRAANLAEQWILLGWSGGAAQDRERDSSHARCGDWSRFKKGDAVAIDFYARLIGRLDQESWAIEGERLIRRLIPVAADPRPLAAEPLLDRPSIELRFTTNVSNEPVLAEVAFAPGTSIAGAKSFLFERLDEVLLRPSGESHTHDHADKVVVCWPAVEHTSEGGEWIDLVPGVRERVVGEGLGAFTGAVEFAKAAGWNAEKAADWLAKHLPASSPSRVAVVPHSRHVEVEDTELLAVAAN